MREKGFPRVPLPSFVQVCMSKETIFIFTRVKTLKQDDETKCSSLCVGSQKDANRFASASSRVGKFFPSVIPFMLVPCSEARTETRAPRGLPIPN